MLTKKKLLILELEDLNIILVLVMHMLMSVLGSVGTCRGQKRTVKMVASHVMWMPETKL